MVVLTSQPMEGQFLRLSREKKVCVAVDEGLPRARRRHHRRGGAVGWDWLTMWAAAGRCSRRPGQTRRRTKCLKRLGGPEAGGLLYRPGPWRPHRSRAPRHRPVREHGEMQVDGFQETTSSFPVRRGPTPVASLPPSSWTWWPNTSAAGMTPSLQRLSAGGSRVGRGQVQKPKRPPRTWQRASSALRPAPAAGGPCLPAGHPLAEVILRPSSPIPKPTTSSAAAEIKADIGKPVPMDRLLCGDVGYGKTGGGPSGRLWMCAEGKQAAMLVPTTVLAQQHYLTALKRFAHYRWRSR